MRFVIAALIALILFFPQGAQAQSDAVFESRNATSTMTIEEYNNVPKGLLLSAEQVQKMNEAEKAKAVDPQATTDSTKPAGDTPPEEALTATSETPTYLLSYEEILRLYREGNFDEALKSLEPLLKSGHAGAQELMGIMYRMGQGVEKDPAKAFELLTPAAEAGRPLAEHHLASMYFTGEGVAVDKVKSLFWIGLAVMHYPDGPEKEQARKDRDNIFLQMERRDRDAAQTLQRDWLTNRGEAHLLDLQ